jgi:hypothetical protein
VGPMFEQRLQAIAWCDFDTAYGPAVSVPDQLRRLAGQNRTEALAATHDLWCGLCHQHVQVGSAALPALPFLLEVMDRADRDITVELLDILLGFALGVSLQRAEDFHLSLGRHAPAEERWVAELRAALLGEVTRFRRLAASSDVSVAELAGCTLAELGVAPDASPGT